MWILKAILWVFCIFGLLAVAQFLLVRRLVRQLRERSNDWNDSLYERYPFDQPPAGWRRSFTRYEDQFQTLGCSPLLWFYNITETRQGRQNFYGVFSSSDRKTVGAVSYMIVERLIPFIGLPLPFPYWSGRSVCTPSFQTTFTSGLRQFTVSDDPRGYEQLPEQFQVTCLEPGSALSEMFGSHTKEIEELAQAKGTEIVQVESAEQYLKDQKEQHKILAEHHREVLERMLRESLPDYPFEDE